METAVFGGGCFWCTEAIFKRVRGVESVTSGYAGGRMDKPNYLKIVMGDVDHAEVVKIEFNPKIISYEDLLDIFWHVHDPTTLNRQGYDVGTQYRSVILYNSEEQKIKAEESLKKISKSGEFKDPIVTKIEELDKFYDAESYHKNFYENNPDKPYCQLVIVPKIQKFLEKYADRVKN
ncbi:peptide-methionine (S)-S-oxide reductase MsrA [Candidatus Daviesbacteria bacterium]|nr:peptide-methionine (S)-S-oxide reductase MsrA [Candidatus Daviesbacteria bacterium]